MPIQIKKARGGGYQVRTPNGVKAKHAIGRLEADLLIAAARSNFLQHYEKALDLNQTALQRFRDIEEALHWNECLTELGAAMPETYLTKLKP